MKRNDDLIRTLMFEAEEEDDWRITELGAVSMNPSPEEARRGYHFILLCDAGLFAPVGTGTYRLTNEGHDWLAAVRDDTVWKNTKEAAAKVGGASIQIMGSIATGFVKQKLVEMGVPIG